MATYYVDSSATGANDGSSWTDAYTSFASAVTAANASGDIIKIDDGHQEAHIATTTYTFQNNVQVLCVDKTSSDALSTGAVIGSQSGSYNVTFQGAYKIYIRGLTISNGASGGSSTSVTLFNNSDGAQVDIEDCKIHITAGANSTLVIGGSTAGGNFFCRLRDCEILLTGSQYLISLSQGYIVFDRVSLDPSTVSLARVFYSTIDNVYADIFGCDFSPAGAATLVGDAGSFGTQRYVFSNCKLGSGMTIKAAATTVLNRGQTTVWAYNCAAGDEHYHLYHADPLGETSVVSSIYANDGAKYDGTNGCSWKITTTANSSFYAPYVSPWLDVYHDGTSAITPYLECLRSGSTTAFQDNEVWSEWSYQGTSGSTQSSIVSDRMAVFGTPANQESSSKTAADWTGEDASNNWFGKLGPSSSFTPAEIGHIRARVVVAEPSVTVYVDPTIRGLS